jgi:hypothetical protein
LHQQDASFLALSKMSPPTEGPEALTLAERFSKFNPMIVFITL